VFAKYRRYIELIVVVLLLEKGRKA